MSYQYVPPKGWKSAPLRHGGQTTCQNCQEELDARGDYGEVAQYWHHDAYGYACCRACVKSIESVAEAIGMETMMLPATHPDRGHGTRDAKSVGHIRWEGDYEIYRVGSEVYIAHYSNVFDLDTNARIGRFHGYSGRPMQRS